MIKIHLKLQQKKTIENQSQSAPESIRIIPPNHFQTSPGENDSKHSTTNNESQTSLQKDSNTFSDNSLIHPSKVSITKQFNSIVPARRKNY